MGRAFVKCGAVIKVELGREDVVCLRLGRNGEYLQADGKAQDENDQDTKEKMEIINEARSQIQEDGRMWAQGEGWLWKETN